jgi:hypothetical protein
MKRPLAILVVAIALPVALGAQIDDVADESMRQFLAQADGQHHIRAVRRLEAENGKRSGWIEAITDSSPLTGFRYQITAEGGSSSIVRDKLREVLEAERDVIARQPARYALARANYTFQPKGVDADGLAAIDVSPKRDDHALIEGTVFLRPSDAGLVRVQGRLVKNPSFWVKKVDITRTYECIGGVNVPVVLQSSVQLRLFGAATMQMTYSYLEIDGRPVPSTTVAKR